MSERSGCKTSFGVKQCQFEGRFNSEQTLPPDRLESVIFWGGDPQDFVKRTYVCDVCVACGRVVKP